MDSDQLILARVVSRYGDEKLFITEQNPAAIFGHPESDEPFAIMDDGAPVAFVFLEEFGVGIESILSYVEGINVH